VEQVYMLLLLQIGSAKGWWETAKEGKVGQYDQVEGGDAVSTWSVTLLLTAKMWIFLPYVTCLYRYNPTAIKIITGKELLILLQSGHVSSALSLYSAHEPVG